MRCKSIMKFDAYQWKTASTVAVIYLLTSCSISLQAPFYPAEAERKGATATEYGIVFSVYELTGFFVSLVAGKIVGRYGLRYLMAGGMMIEATALILFGLLDLVQNRLWFIALSMILRIIEGAGGTVAMVTSLSAIATIFPDDFSTIFAIMETFFGAGLILGPTLGGCLYTIGNFPLPFTVVGVVGFIVGFSALIIFRGNNTVVSPQEKSSDMMPVLRVPEITLNFVCAAMLMITAGFYGAILEPHLRQFNLPPMQTSLFFIIYGVTYVIVTPIFGKCLDAGLEPKILTIAGCICVICSFTIIGPAPFLPYNATIASCIVALVVQGLGYGACIVSGMTGVFRSARKAGLLTENTAGITALLNGLWNASFSIGSFIGPTIAGILYDLVGFRWATQFITGSFVLLTIVVVYFTVATRREQGEDKSLLSNTEERTPLLTDQ